MKSNQLYILLIFILLLILGSSIFLNFLLFNRAKKYYLELNETRLDPNGLNYYPANIKKPIDTSKIRIVFFGDSRAESWIFPDINEYDVSKYEFINRGISSQTSIQTIERFPYHVNSLQPNVVIIQVGINDLKTIGLFPEDKNSIIATCKSNIKEIVDESRKIGATVIISTIFPVGKVPLERQPFWSDEIGKAVEELNTYIKTLAEDKIIVFDAFPILADSQGMMLQEYSLDELHLNERGYNALNKKLVELLKSMKLRTAHN
ncbi:MAG: SGNH/GDSL hydrolase family protein [Mastigocoleus sp.]